MQSVTRPVILTGYEIQIECPRCGVPQALDDDTRMASDEYIGLHAFPGRYLLTYSLRCWTCGDHFGGRISIKSRAA